MGDHGEEEILIRFDGLGGRLGRPPLCSEKVREPPAFQVWRMIVGTERA
jgi:hypothetical protein